LLDVQESYGALSQRHAKLIAELTKTTEANDQLTPIAGENAVDRLKRSQANQQMIEQVVMEYEKTIQSLEANLSTTRGSLATTESSLLERETKCAYIETMNQQLNARVQKLMDRDANTEQYLQDLEARLEDKSSGGEKNDATIAELRKEIARIRESETNAEDYICTLEERLAEADQDMEIMQREVERLEHLVERQRSLGKLDNLLYELDHIQDKDGKTKQALAKVTVSQAGHNGVGGQQGEEVLKVAEETQLPVGDGHELDVQMADAPQPSTMESDEAGLQSLQSAMDDQRTLNAKHDYEALQSPAQSKFVEEKFESVSQELFDLRLEHESTVNELDLLSAKYREALRTLAEMQERIEDGQVAESSQHQANGHMHHDESFLEEEDLQEAEDGQQLPSSRSLSSELSLAGESSTSADTDITPVSKETQTGEVAAQEIERLQTLLAEHEREMLEVTEQYHHLEADHKEALNTVEKLKSQIQRTRPASPGTPGMLRRMTSQAGTGVDRGQRSVTSLRALMAEEFEHKPDRLESAEVHLTAANNELQSRLERIQALEAEMKNSKKEMEIKSTIISGLTRERTSIKVGSPVDLNMVSLLRDQIIQKETELKSLHESYAHREQGMQEELHKLRAQISVVPSTEPSREQDEMIKSLENKLSDLSRKNEIAQKDMAESQSRYSRTKSELEAALASIETLKAQHNRSEDGDDAFERAAAASAMQIERDNYQGLISQLKDQLEEQRVLNADHAEKTAELRQLHSTLSKDLEGHVDLVKQKEEAITSLKAEVSDLQQKLKLSESAIAFHKHGLKSLHDAHATDIEEMKLAHGGILAGYDDQIADLTAKHEELVATHESDLKQALATVQKIVTDAQSALGHPTDADMLASHIQDIMQEKRHTAEANSRLVKTNAELERQLDGRQNLVELEIELDKANSKITNYQETIRSLANEVGNHEENIRNKETLIKKHEETIEAVEAEKAKKVMLIEELEQQLQNSFDQHNNRVSVLTAQGNQVLIDAQARIAQLEKELDHHRNTNEAGSDGGSRSNTMKSQHRPQSPGVEGPPRSNSLTSNLRKTASISSLPSPPPVVPLPPLPTLSGLQVTSAANNPSPPQSRHASKEVTLPVTPVSGTVVSSNSQNVRRSSALIEEQEARLRTIEKHLHAEKQLTATLEEALVDLETQSNKLRVDAEGWKKKAWAMEEEMASVKKERRSERLSVQAVEEEVKKRREAEAARAQLEERMKLLTVGRDGKSKKKKGSSLNCF
jgi:kinesin family protein 4/21/27